MLQNVTVMSTEGVHVASDAVRLSAAAHPVGCNRHIVNSLVHVSVVQSTFSVIQGSVLLLSQQHTDLALPLLQNKS